MIKESFEITRARENLKNATDALAHLNIEDSSNFLDDQEKKDLPIRLEKAATDARRKLDILINADV